MFEVLAVHEPLARLVKRDGTLDGSVPLRVARACVPLLEGNALGHQIVFRRRLVVRSRLGTKTFVRSEALAHVDRAHRTVVPVLVARGHLERRGAWHERLERRWWWTERGVLRIWTGLLVRPRPGTWLRVSSAGSRASRDFRVRVSFVGGGAFVPLTLDIDSAEDGARLEGEVANIVAMTPSTSASVVEVAEAPEVLEAHARFYDARYFASKKGAVTRKYRRTIARGENASPGTTTAAAVRVVHLAGPRPVIETVDHVLSSVATSPVRAPPGERFSTIRFANAIAFRAHFDGNTLDIEPDRAALGRGAEAIESAAAFACGEAFPAAHRGALLYLTKYFTPHPHGEPHFFVKPWALTVTPCGWSSVVEGGAGEGYGIMRGVVWTDRFHATPAVFDLSAQKKIHLGRGAPLLEVVPVPRALLAEEPRLVEEEIT